MILRPSSGEYFVGLDHIRALAALLVFTWHFNHVNEGQFADPYIFPLSLFTEGHIGVALFMTLSGYIFAKLLDGKDVRYFLFLWNRALRLFPLLFFTFCLAGFLHVVVNNQPLAPFLALLLRGFVTPEWPNGGWSIAVELHFYIILPLLLLISARNPMNLLVIIMVAIFGRYLFWLDTGEVQSIAYWTIAGCIDQFVFGILAFKARQHIVNQHLLATAVIFGLLGFIYYFDLIGGFYKNGAYPTESPIWIYYPTVVGGSFAILIAWYDGSFKFKDQGLSAVLAKIGACSYSIYLLHSFIIFRLAEVIDERVISLSNDLLILLSSVVVFLCFAPIAYLSYKLIELPPMRYRRKYLKSRQKCVQTSVDRSHI